jgi:hypothetical protein
MEKWDGTSWSIATLPDIDGLSVSLNGVSCVSTSECWAVGKTPRSLIERWDGNAWSIVSSPNTVIGFGFDDLLGVSCAPTSRCWAVGFFYKPVSNLYVPSQTLIQEYTPIIPPVIKVGSRMTHGSAGTFDVDLPFTGVPGVECRSGGTNGDYTVAFRFINALSSVGGASITGGFGSITGGRINGDDDHEYIVNLTGVTNGQTITVNLSNVQDSAGNSGSTLAASFGVLAGDTTGNGIVNSSDVSHVQSESGQAITAANFRADVTANGAINSTDLSFVQFQSGTQLGSTLGSPKKEIQRVDPTRR